MWRATVEHKVNENNKNGGSEDDWETDPDFINDVTEEEQRWGSKTVAGSGRTGNAINIQKLRTEVEKDDAEFKKKTLETGPKASYGYGGKFGLQHDRMDKSAVGHDYIAHVEKHASQVDAVKGFGGKYGVQADRQDKSAVGWDHHEKVDKHASQKDYASGFGGKYGIQRDRVDKTALGWDHVEKSEKHESQKDYAKGFGGKYGIDKDRQDKSAVGWEYHEKTEKHSSQKGSETGSINASSLRARFENIAKVGEEEAKKRADVERNKREEREKREKEFAQKDEEERQRKLSLQDEKESSEDHKETVSTVRRSVAVPTPLVQATSTAKSSSPETSLFHGTSSTVAQPPSDFKDNEALEDIKKEFEEPSYKELIDSHVLKPSQSYLEPAYETLEEVREELSEESGLSALALYDYQAADSDEISFDPDDIITNIEMIDEGWWRGECRGQIGLFPANYVQLL